MDISPKLLDAVPRRWGSTGRAWLRELPELVDAASARWTLEALAPVKPGGLASYVARGTSVDHGDVVLKIAFDRASARHEIAGLRYWDGDGCVRLLDADETTGTLLLESLRPGTHLGRTSRAAVDVLADLVRAMQRRRGAGPPAAPSLRGVWATAADEFDERHARQGRPLAAFAARFRYDLEFLIESSPSDAYLHGDLHRMNILRDKHRGYLASDPVPRWGELAYEVAFGALMHDARAGVQDRIDALAAGFGLDAERVGIWARVIAAEKVVYRLELQRAVEAATFLKAVERLYSRSAARRLSSALPRASVDESPPLT